MIAQLNLGAVFFGLPLAGLACGLRRVR